MNKEEATKICYLLCSADGHCMHCAEELIDAFKEYYPEYAELADEIFNKSFDGDD